MKSLPWILFAMALVVALYSFALLLNGGGALTDARSEVAYLRERGELALKVIRKAWLGRKEADIESLSRILDQEGENVKVEDGGFIIGDLVFQIRDGLVADIRYTN